MEKTLHILIVGSDPSLKREYEGAIAGVRGRAVAHFADDFHSGIEAARSHQPDLVLAPLTADLRGIKHFAEEISIGAPDAAVIGVYRKDALRGDESEGAIFIAAFRARVQDFLRRPLSATELQQVIDRHQQRPQRSGALGTIAAFASNKGGVGKTTLAVNTATALAVRHPGSVILIDTSLQLGNCASMLDLKPTATIVNAVRQWDRLDETLLQQLAVRHFVGAPPPGCTPGRGGMRRGSVRRDRPDPQPRAARL